MNVFFVGGGGGGGGLDEDDKMRFPTKIGISSFS